MKIIISTFCLMGGRLSCLVHSKFLRVPPLWTKAQGAAAPHHPSDKRAYPSTFHFYHRVRSGGRVRLLFPQIWAHAASNLRLTRHEFMTWQTLRYDLALPQLWVRAVLAALQFSLRSVLRRRQYAGAVCFAGFISAHHLGIAPADHRDMPNPHICRVKKCSVDCCDSLLTM